MKKTVGGVALNRFSVGPVGGGQPITVGAQSCGSCHAVPFSSSAGLAHTRVFFDPDQNGVPPFNPRATTSLFGDGILQLLAQERTESPTARDPAQSRLRYAGTAARQELKRTASLRRDAATANASGEVTRRLAVGAFRRTSSYGRWVKATWPP